MDQLIASTITAVGISIDQNSLKSLFDELGVEKPSDVALICEGDLTGLLKPVQARKVIAYFKSLECLAVADPPEPVEACTNTASVVIARPTCTVSSLSPCGRLPSPYRFPLHSICESLKVAVTNGDHLMTGQRTQLLDAMYHDVTKFTLYPVSSDFNAIVDALFAAFPTLDCRDLATCDVKSLWRSRIIRFFQNARSRRDNDLQIVVSKKRKPTGVKAKTAFTQKPVAVFGVINYLPQRPPGDTDDTISDMMKIMCDESRRLKQNGARIEQLMTQTLADRRKSIVTDGISLADLKISFPCLFSEEQMCSEFSRLTEVNAVDGLQALLQKHGQSIVSIVDSCGKALPALLNERLEAMKAAKSKETERDRMWDAAALGLPFLLGEDVNTIFGCQEKFAFYLNDPSLNSRVMRIGRACDALMDKLSKKRPAETYCSRKRSTSSKANSKHVAPATPAGDVAPATPACEVEVDSDMPDRRPGTSKSKPRLRVSVAPPATIDSDVAHPTKRAKKVPQRLKE